MVQTQVRAEPLKPLETNVETIYKTVFNYIFMMSDETTIEHTMDYLIVMIRKATDDDAIALKPMLLDLIDRYTESAFEQSRYAIQMIINILDYRSK